MQRHLRYLTLVLWFCVSCAAAQSGGPLLPYANGPIRLGDEPIQFDEPADDDDRDVALTQEADDVSSTGDAPPDAPKTAPDNRAETTGREDGDASGADPAAPLARNARPLGAPNGIFSARPVDPVAEVDESDPGWVGSLDPRRNDFVRVLGALAIVIGLLLFARAVLRKTPGLTGGFRPSGVVEVLARYPVGRGQQLIILKLARRVILLHHAGNTMTPLTEIEDPTEVAALLARMESGASGRGKAVFKSVLGKYQDEHKRVMASRTGRRQYWANDVDTGVVVDLTQRSNGKSQAPAGNGAQAAPEIVTRRHTPRRGLMRR